MALFQSLNDEFDSHTGRQIGVQTYIPAHYDLRSFHASNLTVPRTMPDFKYFNVQHFDGTTMITLDSPRSVVGRSIAAHTMADITGDPVDELDAETILELEQYMLPGGDEGWPSADPNVTFGKDASFRYANSIAVALTAGVTKTVGSTFFDDILVDFPADGSTYFIELALPGFPAQASGVHLDLANSWIDISSSASYAPASTDSFRFSDSLVSLNAGGNLFWRINRNSIVNAKLNTLQAIRFRLLAIGGNFTFKAQAMRMYKSGDFTFPVVAVDTKRNTLHRSVPQASSAATEPSTSQGTLFFANTRPLNLTQVVKINSGHNPVGNDNIISLYFRHDPVTTNNIRVQLFARSTQSQILIQEQTNGSSYTTLFTTTAGTNILNTEADYYLMTELQGTKIRATLYNAKGAFYGTLVYTTGWVNVTRNVRGFVGYDINPYNYDFYLDWIKNSGAAFAVYESTPFQSITPYSGVTLYKSDSPPFDLSQSNFISSGDTTISSDFTFGHPAPSTKIVRDGTAFYGGIETKDFLFVGDSNHVVVTGQIWPTTITNRQWRVLLIDKYDTVSWIAYIPGLKANQWNEFTIPVNASVVPADYRFALQQIGNYADTYWLEDVKLNHDTVAWKVSPNNGTSWYDFYNVTNDPYSAINFSVANYQAMVIDAKPLAYWPLDESISPVKDIIGTQNGTFGGGINSVNGIIQGANDKAISFNGSAAITVPDSTSLSFTNNVFSFEFWMKAVDTSTNIGIFGKGAAANYEYAVFKSGATLTFNTYTLTGTAVYPALAWTYDTNWHHIVWQADGSVSFLYVDGNLIATSIKSANSLANGTAALLLGQAVNPGGSPFFNGLLDEFAIYSTLINNDAIFAHYNTGLNSKALTNLKVRAEALSDTAWIQNYRIYPKYQFPGNYRGGPFVTPATHTSDPNSVTQDLRIWGATPASGNTIVGLRITGA